MKRGRKGQGDITCESEILRVMKGKGTPFTAYKLARLIGCTPQHANRTLAKMWSFGLVAYRTESFRNGEKRVWGNINHAELTSDVYDWNFAMKRLL